MCFYLFSDANPYLLFIYLLIFDFNRFLMKRYKIEIQLLVFKRKKKVCCSSMAKCIIQIQSMRIRKEIKKMKTENEIIPWCGLVTLFKNQRCEYSKIQTLVSFYFTLSLPFSFYLFLIEFDCNSLWMLHWFGTKRNRTQNEKRKNYWKVYSLTHFHLRSSTDSSIRKKNYSKIELSKKSHQQEKKAAA